MTNEMLEKVTDEELAAADPKTVARTTAGVAEVEGQEPYIGWVECPWCGMRGRAILDTDQVKYFSCGSCTRGFRP